MEGEKVEVFLSKHIISQNNMIENTKTKSFAERLQIKSGMNPMSL